jgi:DNA-binding response OmpR family regulator
MKLLIIEDDPNFAHTFKTSQYKGFKCLTAATGEDGLVLL